MQKFLPDKCTINSLSAKFALADSKRKLGGCLKKMAEKDNTSHSTKDNSYHSYPVSLRKQVCKLLDENQLLTAKMICKLLNLPYKKYKQTITNYRNYWKYNHENERGSNCSNFHCYKAKVRMDRVLSDDLRSKLSFGVPNAFVGYGWRLSRARNKFLIWKGKLGRVWFTLQGWF